MDTTAVDTKSDLNRAAKASSRLLMAYAATGLLFMFFPGTFLGVWNLFAISHQQAADSVSASWIQAHGHAQIFGWIATFIIGIGYYSMAKIRPLKIFRINGGWICWALWTTGVALRWATNIYQWHWRSMLSLSAALELCGFLVFFAAVSRHRRSGEEKNKVEGWMLVVIGGTIGLLITLCLNLAGTIYLAFYGQTPAFPHDFDQRFLAVTAWGFLVPFVWGFSARWLPVFLGLKPLKNRALLIAFVVNFVGVAFALGGSFVVATILMLLASGLSALALRLFELPNNPAKVRGVHQSFPIFVRLAYLWLVVAAIFGVWAATASNSSGIWGASRHALTVGFLSTMVFCIGPRVLPAFAGMRQLFSTKLMFLSLVLLSIGCAIRVSSEVIAYQGFADAWRWLPVSAVIELSAVMIFALNMACTFIQRPIVKEKWWIDLRINTVDDRVR